MHLSEFTISRDLAEAKVQMTAYAKELNDEPFKPDTAERLWQVECLIEAYVQATSIRPDPYVLYGLGSYILDDYLTDQYKHAKGYEYPFQTERNEKKRKARHNISLIGERTDI